MAVAHLIDQDSDSDTDSTNRIRSAELSDLVFALKRLFGPEVGREEVFYVARAINSVGGIGSITKSDLVARLTEMGQPPELAERLVAALFK